MALRNVEVKARVKCMESLLKSAEAMHGKPPYILNQRDSFYAGAKGRLKLRREHFDQHSKTQLVHYERPDVPGAKLSQYHLCEIQSENAENMHELLSAAFGHTGDLIKTRYLFLVGQTRVHVDRVEGLGDFMELEVVLQPEQTLEQGQAIADDMMINLGISKDDLLCGSYMDMKSQ